MPFRRLALFRGGSCYLSKISPLLVSLVPVLIGILFFGFQLPGDVFSFVVDQFDSLARRRSDLVCWFWAIVMYDLYQRWILWDGDIVNGGQRLRTAVRDVLLFRLSVVFYWDYVYGCILFFYYEPKAKFLPYATIRRYSIPSFADPKAPTSFIHYDAH